VLSDGFQVPGLAVPSLPVIGGDAAAACIAAASVLAKVSRDRLMVAMDTDHPGYGFAVHKGYSTTAHSAALNELGPCPQHRRSFINVRRVASGSGTRVRWETECEPDNSAPDRHGRNGWGKMGSLNQVRDGEGRLSR
jgi:ribonuclease HII